MSKKETRRVIEQILGDYVRAFENANADLMQSLFWYEDPRFIEVENHIPQPFSIDRFLFIMDWIRENQKPGWKMRFYDTQIHLLSPDVAYSVSMREQDEDGSMSTSRVTLLYLMKDGQWKILHGHFSLLPE